LDEFMHRQDRTWQSPAEKEPGAYLRRWSAMPSKLQAFENVTPDENGCRGPAAAPTVQR